MIIRSNYYCGGRDGWFCVAVIWRCYRSFIPSEWDRWRSGQILPWGTDRHGV